MLIPLPSAIGFALSLAVPVLVLLALRATLGRRPLPVPGAIVRALESKGLPVVLGLVTGLITLDVWGSLREPGVVQDEQAYVLQAEIFSQGRWTAEPHPLPAFFEQTHVFVHDALASKYPPGHSLLLVPGVMAGLPGLVPIFFAGLSGTLVFGIARRVADPATALMTWALWSTSTVGMAWRATYLSQGTSTALWLLSLWGLLRWWHARRHGDLAITSVAMAAAYLVRPQTTLVLAVPFAIVIAMGLRRRVTIGSVVVITIPIAMALGVQLLWQERTSGDWLTSPYSEYSRQYFPFVKPGFGADATPPTRAVPPEIQWIADQFRVIHARHEVSALPEMLLARLIGLLTALGQHWRGFLIVLFVVGCVRARGALLFGAASAAVVVLAYLGYAHPAGWVVYYMEVYPVFFLLAAVGCVALLRPATGGAATRDAVAPLAAILLMVPWLMQDVASAKRIREDFGQFHRTARAVLSTLPAAPAVVFVRYPPTHNHHNSIVVNPPDYARAMVWLVHDRGPENGTFLASTDRAAYLLDVGSWHLTRLR